MPHLARHAGLRPAAGSPLGRPLLVLRHDLRPAREQPPAKRRGSARSGPGLLVAIEADLDIGTPWDRGPARSGLGFTVYRDIRVGPKRVLRLMRENNLLSRIFAAAAVAAHPHDGEIITRAPIHVGHRWPSGVHGDDVWGWIFTSVGMRRVCRLACLKRRRPLRAMQPISMGLAGLYGSTAAARLGGWPCGWTRAPSICRRLHQPIQVRHPTVLSPSSPRPRRTASPSGSAHAADPMVASTNIAAGPVRDFVEGYNAQWIVEKNGYHERLQASSGVARRDAQSGPPRGQTCQGTGCANVPLSKTGVELLFEVFSQRTSKRPGDLQLAVR